MPDNISAQTTEEMHECSIFAKILSTTFLFGSGFEGSEIMFVSNKYIDFMLSLGYSKSSLCLRKGSVSFSLAKIESISSFVI